ncbi:MAG: hypothetical protein Q8M07_03810 [Prosthecobacter sp.]|nr:hypothetical protein [Prosthecobacter sp.]
MSADPAETLVETEAPQEGILRKLVGSQIAPAVREMMIVEAALCFPGARESVFEDVDDAGDSDGDGE